MVAEGATVTVRKHDGRTRKVEQIAERSVARVRGIDDDAEAITLGDDLATERTQATPLRTARIGGGVGNVVVEDMG